MGSFLAAAVVTYALWRLFALFAFMREWLRDDNSINDALTLGIPAWLLAFVLVLLFPAFFVASLGRPFVLAWYWVRDTAVAAWDAFGWWRYRRWVRSLPVCTKCSCDCEDDCVCLCECKKDE